MALINNRIFALIWRIFGFLIATTGVALVFSSTLTPYAWGYFSIQANIIGGLFFWFLFVKTIYQIITQGKTGEPASAKPVIHAGIVFLLLITMVGFWIMSIFQPFAIEFQNRTIGVIGENIVHHLVPIWMLADFILFAPHGKINAKIALWWIVYPVAYTIYFLVRAEFIGNFLLTSKYPYFFMDIARFGWLSLAIALGIYTLCYLIALLLVCIDKLLARHLNNNPPSAPN